MTLHKLLAAITTVFLISGVNVAWAQEMDRWLEIQGEYLGELDVDGEKLKAGIQLYALGDKKFQITIHSGGLPGDGSKGPSRNRGEREIAEMKNGKLEFTNGGERIIWSDGSFKAFGGEGETLYGELTRVERKSDTLGMEPPQGANILFDGTTGDNFELVRGKGDPMVDGWLRQGIASKQKFGGDFALHIEFKLPFEPTKSGQARGNSGIYLQGRYEVQMLDSFGLTGEHNECGGIYSIKKPDVNMCYPPESWQTYDIDFTSAKWDGDKKNANARMTVRHNGVLIHDDVEVPEITTAAPVKESAEPGFIFLQDHGSPVRYRNIWVSQK